MALSRREVDVFQAVPDEMVDAMLELILNAAGTSLRNYTMQETKDRMRHVGKSVICATYFTIEKHIAND